MTDKDATKGIRLMITAVTVFAMQDGFSRHLAETYNTYMVIMIRYWFFVAFVVVLAMRQPQGFRAAIRTRHPWLHLLRASLLITEVCAIVQGYTLIGLINSHAIFAVCPLLVAGLAVPLLGERISWQRWAAIGAGLAGVLIILQPGSGVFSLASLLPFAAALMFAIYSLLTRLATRDEPAFVALFWVGIIGAVLVTAIGLPNWQPMLGADWLWMTVYALLALLGNWLLIRCYEVAEASSVQPFAYLQIVLVSLVGIVVYGEVLRPPVLIGGAIVVAAGLFALLHNRRQGKVILPQ
ncbi:MAG: DMT family transporter [Rhodoferax sp.]|nr:DMT family transporter [Pseudorhodobacter sp.]